MSKIKTLTANSLLAFLGLLALSACNPKNDPRWNHDPAKAWNAAVTPDDQSVQDAAFTNYDLNKGYALIKAHQGDLTATVLQPLAKIVLNHKFIDSPTYHTTRLAQMIGIFNAAFVQEFANKNVNPAFAQIKVDYYNTVFAGCTRDLQRDCIHAPLFAADGRHTMIMTLLARDLDPAIETELKAVNGSSTDCIAKSDKCRDLVEERYRRLSMGVYNSNRNQDPDFAFAYLKYARLFSVFLSYQTEAAKLKPLDDNSSMSLSYLAEVHGKIFETLITKYQPKDLNDPEFRAFVENFNPWGYSRTQADLFQYGTGVMFELGAKCCLYQDAAKTQLSQSVRNAIDESQSSKDSFGLSFRQIIANIESEHGDRLFQRLGMGDLIADIKRPDSAFYNEYFFIVDRLFRGHLSSDEIAMMLRNTNPQRARTELPKMISNYIRVYLVYMVVETNRFMADIYRSDLASDKIFEMAIAQSRELTGRWYTAQAQIDLLDKLMNSYFKDALVTSPEYTSTFNLLRSVNRNIYYISAYPNMIIMNYFLSKMKGVISFNSWYGPVSINADTVLKSFFDNDGEIKDPWFHFGKDPEPLDRLMLLYSMEYMLSTESLNSFVSKDDTTSPQTSERSKFFDLIFTKYLGDGLDDLRKNLNDYQLKTLGNPSFVFAKDVCNYEMNVTSGLSKRVIINFLDLDKFTYTGLGDNSLNQVISSFLENSNDSVTALLGQVDYRRTYVRAMMDVVEGDLLRTGAISKLGQPHPDLEKARLLLAQLDEVQSSLTQMFVTNHKAYFNCALRLREIERRRANRLYDEERIHLGQVYDLMKPLADVTDNNDLTSKVNTINSSFFTAANGYKFDRLNGMNYIMSKYDLLMRMKTRIESDIFTAPTDKEQKNYGASTSLYLKPRAVSVAIPDGITREDMYSKGTNINISFTGTETNSREEFIRQGMAALNGKTGSFIMWQGQMESDHSFASYLTNLEAFYLLPKVAGATDVSLEVTPQDLTDAYLNVLANYTLDDYDVENAKTFDSYGHYPKEYFKNILFDKDGMTRLPLFYSLMNDTVKTASIGLEGPGPVFEALDFAQRFNSMQAFVFQPSETVRQSVLNLYGVRAHQRMNKISDLFSYLKQKDASVSSATDLDPRLAQPVYLENGALTGWFQSDQKNLFDFQRYQDHKVLIGNFIQRSGNFYGTGEKVKVP